MRAISKFKKTKQSSSSCSSCGLNMKLADFKSYMYSLVVIAWQRNELKTVMHFIVLLIEIIPFCSCRVG